MPLIKDASTLKMKIKKEEIMNPKFIPNNKVDDELPSLEDDIPPLVDSDGPPPLVDVSDDELPQIEDEPKNKSIPDFYTTFMFGEGSQGKSYLNKIIETLSGDSKFMNLVDQCKEKFKNGDHNIQNSSEMSLLSQIITNTLSGYEKEYTNAMEKEMELINKKNIYEKDKIEELMKAHESNQQKAKEFNLIWSGTGIGGGSPIYIGTGPNSSDIKSDPYIYEFKLEEGKTQQTFSVNESKIDNNNNFVIDFSGSIGVEGTKGPIGQETSECIGVTGQASPTISLGETVKIEQNNMPIIKRQIFPPLKRNNKFVSMLTLDLLKRNRMEFTEKINKHGMIVISPSYKYTENLKDLFVLQTIFTDIDKAPLSGKTSSSITVENITSKAFSMDTLEFFKYYDNLVESYVQNNLESNYTCASRLLMESNKKAADLYPGIDIKIPVKFYKDKFLGAFAGKLFNYNISKKYRPVEEFNLDIMNPKSANDKVFYCKKQIRLLVTPVTWIEPTKKLFGSYLKLHTIEVKYPGAKINSVFDRGQTEMELEIINISI